MKNNWWNWKTVIWYAIIAIDKDYQWMLKLVDKNMHTIGMFIQDSYLLKEDGVILQWINLRNTTLTK